ncbi:uncharacterized protein C8Q71DRAFT_228265 [Rhodofomes roseus]|uniref:Uncharacterized protein n=1 Tax=Rhodofomes roseus TaxID=34475 RepID=A0ABQ8KVV2_9APHY|nr:uncharacterized protein C8Q71DRAFT_228265 [Rhodofomes roseus]KAH9842936.1 hypothetical protein C8Q71DRAFT_228265 [Rhodofomes roseus]
MASALTFPSAGTSSSITLDVPPPSQEPYVARATVPNVFVIPPEEEQDENPPFCYFDAAEAEHEVYSTTPDLEALETALHFYQQIDNRAPTFRRSLQNDSQETIVLPRRGSLAVIRENTLEEKSRRRVMDEDVIEVVKLRRSEGRNDAGEIQVQGMKKSRTFKLRATEALKSIKNVGKMPRRTSASSSTSSSGSGENVRPGRSSEQAALPDTVPRPSTPKLPRRKSLTLSQVFTFSQNHRPVAPEADPEPPTCSPDVERARHSEGDIMRETLPRPSSPNLSRRKSLTFAQFFTFSPNHQPTLTESDVDSLGMSAEGSPLPKRYNMQTMPAIASPSKARSRPLHPSPSIEDYGQVRSAAPTTPVPPSRLSKRRSFRNRISVLDLQKLFTQGSSSAAPEEPARRESDTAGSSELAASTSTFSSSYSLISAGSLSEDELPRRSEDRVPSEDPFGGDLDTEMHLDSLHFDSLHFDPDEF